MDAATIDPQADPITAATATAAAPKGAEAPAPGAAELIEEELLVEEVSIDGMCGVY